MLWTLFVAVALRPLAAEPFAIKKVSASVSVVHGPVNGVLIQRQGAVLAIYGDPRPDPGKVQQLLFTHHRRDVVWAGRRLAERGAAVAAPEAEKALFSNVADFWSRYRRDRFHDYQNQSSRVVADSIRVDRFVRDGDQVHWQGLTIRVLATPGYTRGAVSYLLEVDGKRIACVRDLIYGDGKILDLYSLQDAIPQLASKVTLNCCSLLHGTGKTYPLEPPQILW